MDHECRALNFNDGGQRWPSGPADQACAGCYTPQAIASDSAIGDVWHCDVCGTFNSPEDINQ